MAPPGPSPAMRDAARAGILRLPDGVVALARALALLEVEALWLLRAKFVTLQLRDGLRQQAGASAASLPRAHPPLAHHCPPTRCRYLMLSLNAMHDCVCPTPPSFPSRALHYTS